MSVLKDEESADERRDKKLVLSKAAGVGGGEKRKQPCCLSYSQFITKELSTLVTHTVVEVRAGSGK